MKFGHLEGEQPNPSGTYDHHGYFPHLLNGMILQADPQLTFVFWGSWGLFQASVGIFLELNRYIKIPIKQPGFHGK